MKKVLLILVFAALFAGCTQSSGDNHHDEEEEENVAEYEIYPGEVAELIEAGNKPIVIDLRSTDEYSNGHVVGAISIPFNKLSLDELKAANLDKEDVIFVYDVSGRKGESAVTIISSFGYENTISLAGGFIHWEEDEYPIEQGEPVEIKKDTTVIEGGPRISAKETKHDFGVIPQYGGVVTHDFIVENTGDEKLVISTVSTSCACTSAEMVDAEIEPGETAIVKAIFDPNVHEEPEGRFRRTIFLESNDPTNEEFQLAVYVDIIEGK